MKQATREKIAFAESEKPIDILDLEFVVCFFDFGFCFFLISGLGILGFWISGFWIWGFCFFLDLGFVFVGFWIFGIEVLYFFLDLGYCIFFGFLDLDFGFGANLCFFWLSGFVVLDLVILDVWIWDFV